MFFDVLKSINDPNQQGSVEQLSGAMNTLQQLSAGHGVNASTMQTVMSTLGQSMGPIMRQQSASGGLSSLGSMVGQFAGGRGGASGLPSFITPQIQQQLIQGISGKTGLNAGTLQSMMPGLLSSVMGMLSMGGSKSGIGGSNPLLTAFLDSDRDGDTDLGDVFKFAGRFLNPAR